MKYKSKVYKSEIFEVIHQDAVAMYKVGGITEASMHEYDEMCLLSPKTKQKLAPFYEEKSVSIGHANPVSA